MQYDTMKLLLFHYQTLILLCIFFTQDKNTNFVQTAVILSFGDLRTLGILWSLQAFSQSG